MDYEKEQQTAIEAVKIASGLCERVRQEKTSPTLKKADKSPVTVADFGSQAIISHILTQAFPDVPIIAEEDATLLQQPQYADTLTQVTTQVQHFIPDATPSEVMEWINRGKGKIAPRYWTLDPIDGTKGFIRGDQYAVALALIEQGQVKLGVLGCPALPFDFTQPSQDRGVIFVGVRGENSWMMSLKGDRSQPIQVNPYDDVTEITRLESVESNHSDRTQQIALDQAFGLVQPVKQMDSQAKYGALARGEGDLYVRIPLPQNKPYPENIWDHAAGLIIVEQAGGKVTDLDGKLLDFSLGAKLSQNRGIVVSNGMIHQRVLAEIITR